MKRRRWKSSSDPATSLVVLAAAVERALKRKLVRRVRYGTVRHKLAVKTAKHSSIYPCTRRGGRAPRFVRPGTPLDREDIRSLDMSSFDVLPRLCDGGGGCAALPRGTP